MSTFVDNWNKSQNIFHPKVCEMMGVNIFSFFLFRSRTIFEKNKKYEKTYKY